MRDRDLIVPDPDGPYTVWVGGAEVNDYLLTAQEARRIAAWYIKQGYEDVAIENTKPRRERNAQ